MIHAENRSNTKQLTEEEIKQKQETADKINFHISHFLEARKKLDQFSKETLFEMTLNLAQMSPEIYTIYNVRRELLNKTLVELPEKDPQRYDLIQKELELVNFLLKKQPKSYSLFSHRQWLIVQGLKEEKNSGLDLLQGLIPKELYFCVKMLEKDERNFHVWNYRNWLIDLSQDERFSLKEEVFTKMKVEQNFTNFSALHFRAINFSRFYGYQLVKNQSNIDKIEENKEIVAFGMPLKVISKELEFITTGLYMQTNEQGIWQYHHWLIESLIPTYCLQIIYLADESKASNSHIFLIILSKKCRNFSSKHVELRQEDGNLIEDYKIINLKNIEFSRFYALKLPKELKINKLIIQVKNSYKFFEKNMKDFPTAYVQDFNRKRFLLESEFVFHLDENQNFNIFSMKYCSEEDLKFRKFAFKLFDDSKKIVEEILELEKNNKFVLMEKNFLSEIQYPGHFEDKDFNENLMSFLIKTEATKTIIKNLKILRDNYEKQRNMFDGYLEFYEARLEVEERIQKGDFEGFDLKKVVHLERFEEIIDLLIALRIKTIKQINDLKLEGFSLELNI